MGFGEYHWLGGQIDKFAGGIVDFDNNRIIDTLKNILTNPHTAEPFSLSSLQVLAVGSGCGYRYMAAEASIGCSSRGTTLVYDTCLLVVVSRWLFVSGC